MTGSKGYGGGEEFEDWLLLNPAGKQKIVEKYASQKTDKTLNYHWKATHFNRIAIMNHLAQKIGSNCDYLEIGCDDDLLFSSIPITNKVGVDPVSGGNRKMTSDDFFEQNKDSFDLIFLDGLHTYEQLRRDVENALSVIRPGGYIGIHDLVPRNWVEEHVPRINGAWTGDVWKVGVELARTDDIDFKLILIDHGVGIIKAHSEQPTTIKDLREDLTSARFAVFHDLFDTMPTVNWQEALNWIDDRSDNSEHAG